jgi:hypothetical protein
MQGNTNKMWSVNPDFHAILRKYFRAFEPLAKSTLSCLIAHVTDFCRLTAVSNTLYTRRRSAVTLSSIGTTTVYKTLVPTKNRWFTSWVPNCTKMSLYCHNRFRFMKRKRTWIAFSGLDAIVRYSRMQLYLAAIMRSRLHTRHQNGAFWVDLSKWYIFQLYLKRALSNKLLKKQR